LLTVVRICINRRAFCAVIIDNFLKSLRAISIIFDDGASRPRRLRRMVSTVGHSRPAALQGNNTASLRAPIMSSDTTFNGVEHNTATAAVTSSNLPHSAKFETAASSSFPSLCMSRTMCSAKVDSRGLSVSDATTSVAFANAREISSRACGEASDRSLRTSTEFWLHRISHICCGARVRFWPVSTICRDVSFVCCWGFSGLAADIANVTRLTHFGSGLRIAAGHHQAPSRSSEFYRGPVQRRTVSASQLPVAPKPNPPFQRSTKGALTATRDARRALPTVYS
jgi:hypothetical protein